LKILSCSNNQLTSLEEIQNLIDLEKLYCYDNQLTSLEGIENLVNLKRLCCGNNQLTSLEGMEKMVNLKILYCHSNQLISLEGIENLVNLEELCCSNNQLASLEGMEKIVKLIKNNKQIKNNIKYNFIDSDDFTELHKLFNILIKSDIDNIDESVIKIEKMIIELYGFQKCILK
jgi:Leucine-rich repeat (LRR) protein